MDSHSYKRRSTCSFGPNYNKQIESTAERKPESALFSRKTFIMTFKVCVNLVGLASLCVLASLSSRISEEIHRGKILTTTLRLLHLYTFATWFGMQFWVTFVAGE